MAENISLSDLSKQIKKLSYKFSFDVCKITTPDISKVSQENLRKFVLNEYHGEMSWIKETFERRKSPKSLWSEAKSAIVLGLNYGPESNPIENQNKLNSGNISVYALGDDYHKVVKGKLKQFSSKLITLFKEKKNIKIKVFVDTAPIMEKPLAHLSGIGWQGKHTNLVSKEFGSWLFLGVILINKTLVYDKSSIDNCGNCKMCIEACPTKAIIKPYQLDARKCISYLTIEFKGKIPVNFRKKIGNRIYGCDDCLAVCPWNKFAKVSSQIRFKEKNYNLELSNLLQLDEKNFKETFSRSPIKRIGRDRFIRNCCIAAGNSKNKNLLNNLNRLIADKTNVEIIREAAEWAVKEINNSP